MKSEPLKLNGFRISFQAISHHSDSSSHPQLCSIQFISIPSHQMIIIITEITANIYQGLIKLARHWC